MGDYSFQPTLNSRSVEMEQARADRGEVSGNNRGEYLFYKDHEIRYRQELMRKRMMEEEMEGCTFSPMTNPSRGGTSRVSVMQQSQMWNERRDEWRAQAQEERLHEEMKECTFAPEIDITNRMKGSIPAPRSLEKSKVSKAKGVDEFILRQEAARQAREEARDVPHVAGKNWTRKTTVPQPFNFSASTKKVKALDAPVDKEAIKKKEDKKELTNTRRGFAAPPVAPLEYGEDGEPLYGTVTEGDLEATPRDGRVEARLKRFLSKYGNGSSRSRVQEEEDEFSEEIQGPRGGEHGYYRRMAEARRMRAEKEEQLNTCTGRKWKPSPTKTKSFHWCNPEDAVVKSLQRPVQPLRCDW